MTGWLIRYEAFPHWFSGNAPGYRALMGDGPVIRDDWMRIESPQGAAVGYSHTWIESDVESAAGGAVLYNQAALTLAALGQTQRVTTSIRAALDARHRLQHFQVAAQAGAYDTRIEGRRETGTEFAVRIRTGRAERTLTLSIPDDVILYSPATDLALAGLRPGQSLTLRVLDPVTLARSDLRVEALRRETVRHAGRAEPATVVAAVYRGLETRAWLDGGGRVLRQETPFGWTLVRAEPGEALAGGPPGGPAGGPASPAPVPAPAGSESCHD